MCLCALSGPLLQLWLNSLRWWTATFQNALLRFNLESATHDPEGYMFEHGINECATGVVRALSVDTTVTLDATRLVMTLHAPTTLVTIRLLKVLLLGLSLLLV